MLESSFCLSIAGSKAGVAKLSESEATAHKKKSAVLSRKMFHPFRLDITLAAPTDQARRSLIRFLQSL